MRLTPPVTACLNCDRPITTTPGKRAKLYCDPSCKSNYRQKQQRLAKKESAGLPLPSDFVDTSKSGVGILHPDGSKEKISYKKAGKKAFDGKKSKKLILDEVGTGNHVFPPAKNKNGKTRQSRKKVAVNDLNEATGKKVITEPPSKSNRTIDTRADNLRKLKSKK